MITFSAVLLAVLVAFAALQYSAKKTRDEQMRPIVNAALVSRGIAMAGDYRFMLHDHWRREGELLCDNADLGLPPYRPEPEGSLQSVEVTSCGEITLTYDEKSGVDGGIVLLTATVVDAPLSKKKLDWQCSTNDYPDLGPLLHGCVTIPAQ